MSRFPRFIAVLAIVFLAFALAACFQPVDLDEFRDAYKNPNGANGENGDGRPVADHSPKLGRLDGEELSPSQPVTVSLSAKEHPSSLTLRVINAEDFSSISWRVNSVERGTGAQLEVNPTAAGSPFATIAEHSLTVIAVYTNGIPYDTFIIIRVVN